jgi:hypothetical protein
MTKREFCKGLDISGAFEFKLSPLGENILITFLTVSAERSAFLTGVATWNGILYIGGIFSFFVSNLAAPSHGRWCH